MQPVVAIAAGSMLMVTVSGDLTALQTPPVTRVISPIFASNPISARQISSREFQLLFSVNVAANSILKISFETFRLPSTSSPGSDAVEAALVDADGNVFAPSSTGSYPAIFAKTTSGSSVGLSSSVANAADVSVTVTLFVSIPIITMIRLSGLGFVAFAGSAVGRRLLQDGISCSNLNYAGQGFPSASYTAQDGELTVTFPGGSAFVINTSLPSVCKISGFRNPAAAVASAGVMVTTYDQSSAGHGVQSGVVFPPIICASGYLQTAVGNSVSCTACPKGTYSDKPGSLRCAYCPAGTYSSTEAATSSLTCSLCPSGTFSNNAGATNISTCTQCLPGTKSSTLGSLECDACSSGTYAESWGQQACDNCRAGSFLMQSGATSNVSCSSCAAGTYSVAGSAFCTRCPPGTGSKEGDPECSKCPEGTYSTYGECLQCPSISYSLTEGAVAMSECSGILVVVGENQVAYNIGICILIMYILSFSFVPAWSTKDTIMRFSLTANFEERLKQKKAKATADKRRTTWFERISNKLSNSSDSNIVNNPAIEKRFFEVGDSVMWDGHLSDGIIGTVESTSVYPEQDADEFGDFVVFIKIEANFMNVMQTLAAAAEGKSGEKPVLTDSVNQTCRCQLLEVPQSHARMPILGFQLGRWELVRQISACFQLLLLSFFPAVDTITDLVYILSQKFFNYYLFAASVLCIFSQLWVFVIRLKKRRVFEAFKERKIELTFLKGLSWWPKWASPDSLPVFLALILPFYFVYHVVFPVVWFFVGYVIYSFQLFPISRISNRWLYMFVYSFSVEKDSYRRRFDTCDAIILPMAQKCKVEETIFESVPQLVIQLINGYLLGEIANMPAFAKLSVCLSALSLSSTIWCYAYWNLVRCKPIRDGPSSLFLYNYKLSGVKDGMFSFGKPSHDVMEIEMAERDNMLSITIADSVLNEDSTYVGSESDAQSSSLPKKSRAARPSEIEVAHPEHADDPVAGNDVADVDALYLQTQLDAARDFIAKLEAEKRQIAEEHKRVKQVLLKLSVSSQSSAAVVPSVADVLADSRNQPHEMVQPTLYTPYFVLMREQVQHAATKVQSVMRGHFGRCMFRARCSSVARELIDEGGGSNSGDASAGASATATALSSLREA